MFTRRFLTTLTLAGLDPAKRRELYRQLAQIFNHRLPLLPLYHNVSLYAHGRKVADFYMDHNFRPLLNIARPRKSQ